MCSSPDDAAAGLQECDLPGARFPYIWLDAICIKSSGEGRAKSTAPGGVGMMNWTPS